MENIIKMLEKYIYVVMQIHLTINKNRESVVTIYIFNIENKYKM